MGKVVTRKDTVSGFVGDRSSYPLIVIGDIRSNRSSIGSYVLLGVNIWAIENRKNVKVLDQYSSKDKLKGELSRTIKISSDDTILVIDTGGDHTYFNDIVALSINAGVRTFIGPLFTETFETIQTNLLKDKRIRKKKLQSTVFISPISSGELNWDYGKLKNLFTSFRLYANTSRSARFLRDSVEKTFDVNSLSEIGIIYESTTYGMTYVDELKNVKNSIDFVRYDPDVDGDFEDKVLGTSGIYSDSNKSKVWYAVAIGARANMLIQNKPAGTELVILDASYFYEMEKEVEKLPRAEADNVYFIGYAGSPFSNRVKRISFIQGVEDKFGLGPPVEALLSFDAMEIGHKMREIYQGDPAVTPEDYRNYDLSGLRTVSGEMEFRENGDRLRGQFMTAKYTIIHEKFKRHETGTNYTWNEIIVGDFDNKFSQLRDSSVTNINMTLRSYNSNIDEGRDGRLFLTNIHGIQRTTSLEENENIQFVMPTTLTLELFSKRVSNTFYSQKPLKHDTGMKQSNISSYIFPSGRTSDELSKCREITILIPQLHVHPTLLSYVYEPFVSSSASHINPNHTLFIFSPQDVTTDFNSDRVEEEKGITLLHVGLNRLIRFVESHMINLEKLNMFVHGSGELVLNTFPLDINTKTKIKFNMKHIDVPSKWLLSNSKVKGGKAGDFNIDSINKLLVPSNKNVDTMKFIVAMMSPLWKYNMVSFGENGKYSPAQFKELVQNQYVSNSSDENPTGWESILFSSSLGKLAAIIRLKKYLDNMFDFLTTKLSNARTLFRSLNRQGKNPKRQGELRKEISFYTESISVGLKNLIGFRGVSLWMLNSSKNTLLPSQTHLEDFYGISSLMDNTNWTWETFNSISKLANIQFSKILFNNLNGNPSNSIKLSLSHPERRKILNDALEPFGESMKSVMRKHNKGENQKKLSINFFNLIKFDAYYSTLQGKLNLYLTNSKINKHMIMKQDSASDGSAINFLSWDIKYILEKLYEFERETKSPPVMYSSSIGVTSKYTVMTDGINSIYDKIKNPTTD